MEVAGMDEHIARALRIERSSTVADRRVDITTTGARIGKPRREAQRRRVFTELLGDINASDAIPHPAPQPTVEDWLAGSPLVEIHLVDTADI
jgi:hypothetical protein